VWLFIGDDWAEDHHDVELQDETGRRLALAKLPEGMTGISRLHTLVGKHVNDDEDVQVAVGIETDRGMWVQALAAAGYQVYPLNPLQVARFRERLGVSGAKSDPGDAHTMADLVRTERHQLRPIAGDSDTAAAVKVTARAHKRLIWERTRHAARLRHALLDFFPAALGAFEDLNAPDTLELLGRAPDPDTAAKLSRSQIAAALKRARRRDIDTKTKKIMEVLRAPGLRTAALVTGAYAASVRAQVAILTTLNTQITVMEQQVDAHFGQHPDAEIYRSQPGLGTVLGARVLGEFGDDPDRYADAKARKNYAGTSPITRQSGKMRLVMARYVHNDRLIDALDRQAFAALSTSPGARAYYDRQRARGVSHHAALRQLANRLVGILHGCLKTHTCYDEATAWPDHVDHARPAAA